MATGASRTYAPGMLEVTRLDELVELAGALGDAYVRFSAGPAADADEASCDGESGAPLPGLSVASLAIEPWWTREPREWLARRLRQYAHLAGGERYAWVLTGRLRGRGPDYEPLVQDIHPVAVLDDAVLMEADEVHRESLDPGRLPRDTG